MIYSSLTDLDELLLKCRDEKAKSYVAEAIACYRAGALRSAVVSTWIAVCFDIIDKLRELALSGDGEAETQISELDKIHRSGDVQNALIFERGLLATARDKFELISPLEFTDLERLQIDRNRCAHPSLISENLAYIPSAELVRAHIHSAITHLLQHPPAQGKYALERLKREVDSEYFPTQQEKIEKIFMSGPLRKPRDSLTRNFALILMKRIIAEDTDKRYTARSALIAVKKMHPANVEALLKDRFSKTVHALEEEKLPNVIVFLEGFPESWEHLDDGAREKIDQFVRKLPANNFDDLDFLVEFEPLKKSATQRIKYASRDELQEAIFFITPPPVIDRMIELYINSKSYDSANSGAKLLIEVVETLSNSQVSTLIAGAANNREVTGSFGLTGLINKIRSRKRPISGFDDLLTQHSLKDHIDETAKS